MAGWILLFGLVCFGAGWFTEWNAKRTADKMTDSCIARLTSAKTTADRDEALLLLYRSQAELARKNFGNVADALAQAKQMLGASLGDAAASIETATKAAAGGDAATASDAIASALKTLDVAGGQPSPSGSPVPSATH